MAKRFTDTEKWKDEWYISLSNDYRIIWQWLLDNCSHAGFCKRSVTLLNMMCRTDIKEDNLLANMEGRIIVFKDYWFIPNFIKYQYSTLYSGKPAVISVVKELFDRSATHLIPEHFGNDYIIITESFANHCQMIKDKDKDKDKYKVKNKDTEDSDIEDTTKHPLLQCEFVARRDQQWMERNKPTDAEFQAFNNLLLDQGEERKDYADYKKHFSNWKKKQKPAEPETVTVLDWRNKK